MRGHHRRDLWLAPLVLTACALLVAACSTTSATPSPPAPGAAGGVIAGTQVGSAPAAPGGWTPPGQIAPISPPPGMFQSVGDAPAQPMAKVRVFFLGMQW
jgi:hypothetical protein